MLNLCLLFTQLIRAYDEFLYLEPIANQRVLTKLTFSFKAETNEISSHYRRYPRLIDEITAKLGVVELDLELTRGSTEDVPNVPYGAYLLATFDTVEHVDKRWKSLVGQLAGLFCISLNQLDSGASFSPSWPLAGQLPLTELATRRVGFLPREVACTENLTPWKKVLPTGAHVGLGSLLRNPHHQLKQSSFWSIGVKFARDNDSKQLELSHSMIIDVATKADLDMLLHLNLSEIPLEKEVNVISPSSLFGVSSAKVSPIVSNTKAQIKLCDHHVTISQPSFDRAKLTALDDESSMCTIYAIPFEERLDFTLAVRWPATPVDLLEPSIKILRQLGGAGLNGQGKIINRLQNLYPESKVASTLEMVPWWIYPKIAQMTLAGCTLLSRHYTPAEERKTGALLLLVEIEPFGECIITYDYSTRWPKWTEYPADANYGRFMPGLMLTYSNENVPIKVHSPPLLIYVPIPDFSMPYNVLCLVCTVLAMGIGTIHNLTTDQLVDADVAKPDTNLGKIVYFVKNNVLMPVITRIKSKLSKSQEPTPPPISNDEPVEPLQAEH